MARKRIYTPAKAKKMRMARTDAWDKANTRKITIKFMLKTERELLDQIDKQPNKSAYIKNLIRDDIKKGGA